MERLSEVKAPSAASRLNSSFHLARTAAGRPDGKTSFPMGNPRIALRIDWPEQRFLPPRFYVLYEKVPVRYYG
jgi:hypothetical protein